MPLPIHFNNYVPEGDPESGLPCPVSLTDEWGKSRKAVVFYSLGNFVSRMYTPSCQIGVISSMTLHKHAETLVTEWSLNGSRYIYNILPAFPGRKHRVIFYEEYRDRYLNKPAKRNRRIREEADFMIRHFGL